MAKLWDKFGFFARFAARIDPDDGILPCAKRDGSESVAGRARADNYETVHGSGRALLPAPRTYPGQAFAPTV